MKWKLTESQQSGICKLINLLNKKWRNKNPPQATELRLHEGSKAHVELESEKCLGNGKTKKKKKKKSETKRDDNKTAALVWTVSLMETVGCGRTWGLNRV